MFGPVLIPTLRRGNAVEPLPRPASEGGPRDAGASGPDAHAGGWDPGTPDATCHSPQADSTTTFCRTTVVSSSVGACKYGSQTDISNQDFRFSSFPRLHESSNLLKIMDTRFRGYDGKGR